MNDSRRFAFCDNSVGGHIGTSLLIPSFSLVKKCTLLIPVPWNDPFEVLEEGIRSIMSKAAIVKITLRSTVGQTILSTLNCSQMEAAMWFSNWHTLL